MLSIVKVENTKCYFSGQKYVWDMHVVLHMYVLIEAALEFVEGEVWRPAGKPGLCLVFSACM